jgi:t-SNARE complex subunit (syntaxin)
VWYTDGLHVNQKKSSDLIRANAIIKYVRKHRVPSTVLGDISSGFLSARKAGLKKGFQHLVVLVVVVLVVVVLVGTRVKKGF